MRQLLKKQPKPRWLHVLCCVWEDGRKKVGGEIDPQLGPCIIDFKIKMNKQKEVWSAVYLITSSFFSLTLARNRVTFFVYISKVRDHHHINIKTISFLSLVLIITIIAAPILALLHVLQSPLIIVAARSAGFLLLLLLRSCAVPILPIILSLPGLLLPLLLLLLLLLLVTGKLIAVAVILLLLLLRPLLIVVLLLLLRPYVVLLWVRIAGLLRARIVCLQFGTIIITIYVQWIAGKGIHSEIAESYLRNVLSVQRHSHLVLLLLQILVTFMPLHILLVPCQWPNRVRRPSHAGLAHGSGGALLLFVVGHIRHGRLSSGLLLLLLLLKSRRFSVQLLQLLGNVSPRRRLSHLLFGQKTRSPRTIARNRIPRGVHVGPHGQLGHFAASAAAAAAHLIVGGRWIGFHAAVTVGAIRPIRVSSDDAKVAVTPDFVVRAAAAGQTHLLNGPVHLGHRTVVRRRCAGFNVHSGLVIEPIMHVIRSRGISSVVSHADRRGHGHVDVVRLLNFPFFVDVNVVGGGAHVVVADGQAVVPGLVVPLLTGVIRTGRRRRFLFHASGLSTLRSVGNNSRRRRASVAALMVASVGVVAFVSLTRVELGSVHCFNVLP